VSGDSVAPQSPFAQRMRSPAMPVRFSREAQAIAGQIPYDQPVEILISPSMQRRREFGNRKSEANRRPARPSLGPLRIFLGYCLDSVQVP
jgi:hypothetical protein